MYSTGICVSLTCTNGTWTLSTRAEVVHQRRRLGVGEAEGRHAHLEPRADGHRLLEEAEQPIRLHLGAFAVEDRRRQLRRVLVAGADGAALPFDDVAADAVVARHHAAAGHFALAAQIVGGMNTSPGTSRSVRLARKTRSALMSSSGEVELRHHLLDALGGVGARRLQLVDTSSRPTSCGMSV